jgi:hypothetical protein
MTAFDPYGAPPIAGHYDQIPLNNQLLLPLGDLMAAGGYGRLLNLPDDIIPTMGLTTLVGSKNGAKLLTGQHTDGAADVYVVNQSGGGGGGTSPSAYNTGNASTVSLKFGANAGFQHIDSAQSLAFIYGFVGGISLDTSGSDSFPGDCSYEITIELVGHGGFDIANGTLGWYGAKPPNTQSIFADISVLLPAPIDVAKTWGSTGVIRTFFAGETADFWVSFTLLAG